MKLWILLVICYSLNLAAQVEPFFTETIYDSDDRMSVTQMFNPELAKPVVVGIAHRFARQNPEIIAPTLERRYRLCPDVRFSQEPSIGDCSGVHVGDGIILTANHCVKNNYDCEKLSWAFDYTEDAVLGDIVALPNLFQCESILEKDESLDVVLIKLKSPPTLPKAKLRFDSQESSEVFALGSPLGLPLKHSGYGRSIKISEAHLVAAIDVFRGNSGSPVYNLDEELVGILVSGGRDFERSETGCLKNFTTGSSEPQEEILLINALPEKMKKVIQRAQASR